MQQRIVKNRVKQRKQHTGYQRTIKSKRRTSPHQSMIPAAQRTAHHTGGAHAKQVVHRIKCKQHRRRQCYGRILHRIVQHPYKISVRQIIDHHHKRTEYRRYGQRHHSFLYRHLLKQGNFLRIFHGFSGSFLLSAFKFLISFLYSIAY